MLKVTLLGAVLGLMCGCAQGVDISTDVVVGPLTLSPEGDIPQDKLEEFANRWAIASGTEVVVAAGGSPVRFVNTLDSCGNTYRDLHGRVAGIDILVPGNPHCRPDHDLLHELGHAVCDHGVIGDRASMCHTLGEASLMFASDNGVMHIDEESLVEVCSHRDCGAFNPEAL
jgi:hypothetical protein